MKLTPEIKLKIDEFFDNITSEDLLVLLKNKYHIISMETFLNELSDDQLKNLMHVLEWEIDGDVNYFIWKIKEELNIRK